MGVKEKDVAKERKPGTKPSLFFIGGELIHDIQRRSFEEDNYSSIGASCAKEVRIFERRSRDCFVILMEFDIFGL